MRLTNAELSRAKEAGVLISKHYPKCFLLEHPKPLKKNIEKDLMSLKEQYPDVIVSKKVIKRFLGFYSTRPEYIQALRSEGAMRIDLGGVTVEAVSEEEMLMAQTRPRKLIVEEKKPKATAADTKDLLTTKVVSRHAGKIKLPGKIKGKQKSVSGTKIIVKPKRKVLSLKRD